MTAPTRRERLRETTLQEIADAGRRQLREVGAAGLTLSAVARDVGMSAPALYRYVDGVDGLLTLLITEGYASLGSALHRARAAVPDDDPGGQFVAVARAARRWAVDDVAQWALLFGSPLPGYAAPVDGPTTAGARRASDEMWEVLVEAQARGLLASPVIERVDEVSCPALDAKADGPVGLLPQRVQAAGWGALALLLGAIAMDVFGHMPPADEPVRAAMFENQITAARHLVGLPAPRDPA